MPTNYDLMSEHEAKKRKEFVRKIIQSIEADFINDVADGLNLEENVGRSLLDIASMSFMKSLNRCKELCLEYITIFENEDFWKDVMNVHRKT